MSNEMLSDFALLDQLLVLRKRKRLIAIVTLLVLMVVGFLTFAMTPEYKATTKLLIERDNPNVVSFEEIMALEGETTDYYQTQYEIIQSRSVALAVARELELHQSEEFFPEKLFDVGKIIGMLNFFESDEEKLADRLARRQEMLLEAMADNLIVAPVRNSRIVDIGFTAKDPVLAAAIANAYAEAYIEHNLDVQLNAVNDAIDWLNKRIQEERAKVNEAQKRFQAFREQHDIITDFTEDEENVTAQKLAEINSQVIEAQGLRVEAQTRFEQTREALAGGTPIESIPEVLNNEFIQSIKESEVELIKTLSELSQKKGPNHPQIKAIKAELGNLRARMRLEAQQVVAALKSEYEAALAREESLLAALDRQKLAALELNKLSTEYNALKREVKTSEEMHDLLIKRFKEASLEESMNTGNIRVVDRAEVPQEIFRPRKKLNLALGLLFGLALGVGLAFFAEYLDDTLKTPDDVKNVLKIPFLGHIPRFDQGDVEGGPEPLITVTEPKSVSSEAYRGLRTSILFSRAEVSPKVIQVSSSSPGEGKSTTAANLAATFAQAGARTLLIDCDMRKPRLHKFFERQQRQGLSNILTNVQGQQSVSFATEHDNLFFCPVGPIPPNPTELLSSPRMAQFMEYVRSRYERIVVDTPPITAVADAVILGAQADGVILVCHAFETRRGPARSALEKISESGATVLGAVLNNVDQTQSDYYYNHYYYYYYGDTSGDTEASGPKKAHYITRI